MKTVGERFQMMPFTVIGEICKSFSGKMLVMPMQPQVDCSRHLLSDEDTWLPKEFVEIPGLKAVNLDQLTINTIEVASGIMVVSKSSLVCSKVTIDNVDAAADVVFRKGLLDMKSNKAEIKETVI